jgi:uncharacterized protein YlxP (DUF503 family)
VLDGIRNRYPVAAAETDHQDRWQRADDDSTAFDEMES